MLTWQRRYMIYVGLAATAVHKYRMQHKSTKADVEEHKMLES